MMNTIRYLMIYKYAFRRRCRNYRARFFAERALISAGRRHAHEVPASYASLAPRHAEPHTFEAQVAICYTIAPPARVTHIFITYFVELPGRQSGRPATTTESAAIAWGARSDSAISCARPTLLLRRPRVTMPLRFSRQLARGVDIYASLYRRQRWLIFRSRTLLYQLNTAQRADSLRQGFL